jgi:hypothetical protein
MATCIYCQCTDPSCGFNKEHVVPEALGTFRNSLTLADSEVCGDCNQHFGDTLDLFLTRDSAEALLRFRHGLKDPAEMRGMFKKRVRVRVPQDGSKWGGLYLDLVPPPGGVGEPNVDLVPSSGTMEGVGTFTETQIREQPNIADQIRHDYSRLRIAWYEGQPMKDRILALLAEKGIRFKSTTEFEALPPTKQGGKLTVEVELLFDVPLARGRGAP